MSRKIRSLSIGNSFSQDALEYAHAIAAADGLDWETVNMFCLMRMYGKIRLYRELWEILH